LLGLVIRGGKNPVGNIRTLTAIYKGKSTGLPEKKRSVKVKGIKAGILPHHKSEKEEIKEKGPVPNTS